MNFLVMLSLLLAMAAGAPALNDPASSKELNPNELDPTDADSQDNLQLRRKEGEDEEEGLEDEEEGEDEEDGVDEEDDMDMDDVGTSVHVAYINATDVDGQHEHDVTAAVSSDDYVYWHNYYRKKHRSTGSLKKSSRLRRQATRWAKRCSFRHSSGSYIGSNDGENLAQGYNSVTTYKAAIKMWYNEIKYWSFSRSRGNGRGATGHFTQMIWKSTKYVGCYRKYCGKSSGMKKRLTVCQYYPAGNYAGRYKSNVQRKK